MITKPDPEKLTALLEQLGFSVSEFFNDDGSLKSHTELADKNPLPYTLADYHHQLTAVLKDMPPAERFALFVQLLSEDGDAPPVRVFILNFSRAIASSINAGEDRMATTTAA